MLTLIRGLAAVVTCLAVTVAGAPAALADTTADKTASTLIDQNDCNGQPITGTGTLHLIQVNDGSAFRNTFYGHFEATDSSGNKYVANIQFSSVVRQSDFIAKFRDVLVSQGPAPNETFLITVSFQNGVFSITTSDFCTPSAA